MDSMNFFYTELYFVSSSNLKIKIKKKPHASLKFTNIICVNHRNNCLLYHTRKVRYFNVHGCMFTTVPAHAHFYCITFVVMLN